MATTRCTQCGAEIRGEGFAGQIAGVFCGPGCRTTAEIEVTAKLILAQEKRRKKRT